MARQGSNTSEQLLGQNVSIIVDCTGSPSQALVWISLPTLNDNFSKAPFEAGR